MCASSGRAYMYAARPRGARYDDRMETAMDRVRVLLCPRAKCIVNPLMVEAATGPDANRGLHSQKLMIIDPAARDAGGERRAPRRRLPHTDDRDIAPPPPDLAHRAQGGRDPERGRLQGSGGPASGPPAVLSSRPRLGCVLQPRGAATSLYTSTPRRPSPAPPSFARAAHSALPRRADAHSACSAAAPSCSSSSDC